MNPKLQKVTGEIEKLKAKITEHQSRLRELERQKTELENAEIVAIFRKEKLTENDFAAFVRQMSGHSEPEPSTAPAEARHADPFRQEDDEDENEE